MAQNYYKGLVSMNSGILHLEFFANREKLASVADFLNAEPQSLGLIEL